MANSFKRSNTRRIFFRYCVDMIYNIITHVKVSSIYTPRDLVKLTINFLSWENDRLFSFCLDPININSVFVMLRRSIYWP